MTAVPGFGSVKHVRIGGLIAKRWPVVVGVLLVAAAVALLWWLPWGPPEPVYEGHPISYWLAAQAGVSKSIPGGAVMRIPSPPSSLLNDSNAVPFLMKASERDSWFGAACYRKWLWPKLPTWLKKHLPAPPSPEVYARIDAMWLLADMWPVAKPSIPVLVRALREKEEALSFRVRYVAAAALGRLGEGDRRAIAAVTEALNDNDHLVRNAATNALLKLDPQAVAKAGVKVPKP